jgi:putative toxin-antitoxin system antitoxin component (TIGR02293 family)
MKTRKPKATTYEQVHDNHAMVQRVEEGLPVMDVVKFSKQAGFTNDELARLINIPARTYARRLADKGRFKVHEGERAARLMRVFDRAKRLFVTDGNTREWFSMQLPALGWRTPLDFAQTEPGAREVEAIVERLEDGVVM